MSKHDETLRQKAVENVREMILNGVLKPGERLILEDLAKDLNMSRLPIREAIRQLQAEGLITVINHKGTFVSKLTTKDVQDVYKIRSILEGEAAKLGTKLISQDDIKKMESILELMEQNNLAAYGPKNWLNMNEKFHLILYEATGNQRIVKMISNLMVETSSYVRLAVIIEGQKPRAKSYHRKILEAVKKRDGEKAEALTKEHLHLTEQTVIEYLIKTCAT